MTRHTASASPPTRRDLHNAAARKRLLRASLPAPVRVHALGRSAVPDLPYRAVASYWRHHPVRADRLARALAARSAAPEEWRWRLAASSADRLPKTFRTPPAPFREAAHRALPGTCCICGQPVYRLGWHRDHWGEGTPNRRARWHGCCVAAWRLWNAPAAHVKLLARLQRRRCAASGERLLRGREVDHRVPLHRVWRAHRDAPWPALLSYWGFPNLQVINREAHASKSTAEALERAAIRATVSGECSAPPP